MRGLFGAAVRVFCKASSGVHLKHRQTRLLHLYEYQSKELLADYGLPIQPFTVVSLKTMADAQSTIDSMLFDQFVIKAQISAGARGKGHFIESGLQSGVHLRSFQQRREIVPLLEKMLGNHLVTPQTLREGELVSKVSLAQALDISHEFYLGFLLDRSSQKPLIIASTVGGADVEQSCAFSGKHLRKFPIENLSAECLPRHQSDSIAEFLFGGFSEQLKQTASDHIQKLYRLFIDYQCIQLEINPYAITPAGNLVCFDAKITLDDNSAFKIPSWNKLWMENNESPSTSCAPPGVSYVQLSGNLGCVVNGAGLAMATSDAICLFGGRPANFLDVGGNATSRQIADSIKMLMHPSASIRCLYINIFGGILKADAVAEGVIDAMGSSDINTEIPVVVRLCGTCADSAKEMLKKSKLPVFIEDDFEASAKLAVQLAAGQDKSKQTTSRLSCRDQ